MKVAPTFFIHALKSFREFLLRISALIGAFIARKLCRNLIITCDSDFKKDGSGAQIQRQFAVYVLADAINCRFVYSPICDVAVHPLDPFQSESEYLAYLDKLNHVFRIDSNSTTDFQFMEQVYLSTPSVYSLIWLGFKAQYFKKQFLIKIGEPYRISEYFQDGYSKISLNLTNWNKFLYSKSQNEQKTIAMHFRQGVGGRQIYPGQKIPRELDIEYFINSITSIVRNYECRDFKIVVLTDAPEKFITYTPPSSQQSLWEGSPGFKQGQMNVSPFSFSDLNKFGVDVEIISGGDPMDAIRVMAQSDFLIMGRSSLSFVAGVLNKNGVVFSPPGFWHNPLSGWILPRP